MKAVPNQACVMHNDILCYETSDGVKWSVVEINIPYVFHRGRFQGVDKKENCCE